MSSRETLDWIEAFKCSRCGAPLDVSPDTLLVVCKYCGYPNPVIGNIRVGLVYVVPSRFDEDSIVKHVKKRIRGALITSVKGYYVPYWFFNTSYTGNVEYVPLLSIKGVKTRKKAVKDVRLNYVFGRRHVDFPGIHELAEHYMRTNPETRRLDELEISSWARKGMEMLNVDMDYNIVELLTQSSVVTSILKREKLFSMKRIVKLEVNTEMIGQPRLVFLPMWIIKYRVGGSVNTVVVSGWDGEIVYGEYTISYRDILLDTLKLIGVAIAIVLYMVISFLIPYSTSLLVNQYYLIAYTISALIAGIVIVKVFKPVFAEMGRATELIISSAAALISDLSRFETEDTAMRAVFGLLSIVLTMLFVLVYALVQLILFVAGYVVFILPMISSIIIFTFTSTIFLYLAYLLVSKLKDMFSVIRRYRRR